MEERGAGGRGMSLTTGALVLRSVSLFLSRGRSAAAGAVAEAAALGAGGAGGVSGAQSVRAHPRVMTQPNKLPPKQIDALKRRTHFNKAEIEGLYAVYRKLVALATEPPRAPPHPAQRSPGGGGGARVDRNNTKTEGIEQSTFRELLHNTFDLVTEEVLVDRIFATWDRGNDGTLRFDNWVAGLSVFLRGTPAERRVHCFSVYDLNSDGYINKDEMFLLLKNCLLKQPGEEDPDEGVRDLVELVLRKLDVDKDGRVSFDDYRESVEREPLLLEAFGQCLPAAAECDTFLDALHS